MQFKHPEILYFLFLLVIPILVHLFQLRRFKKEYFTNVKLLRQLQQQTRKSSTIKKWLLLATRLLLLAFLILAFAQPFFTAKESKSKDNELIILLDNSFSMQAKGSRGELLKRSIQDILEAFPENQTFSILTTNTAFWDVDRKTIQTELQKIDYSALPFELDYLLTQVATKKPNTKKDFIIITDAVGVGSKKMERVLAENEVYFMHPKAENKNNISIEKVTLSQVLETFYEITIALKSYGENTEPISVAVYNQENVIAKSQVTFETSEKEIKINIPKAAFHGKVILEDNSLAYDNAYYFSISQPKKQNVICIGTPEKNKFLNKILTDKEFIVNNTELTQLNYNAIENQQTIILNEIKEIPQALATTLASFYSKGGAIIFIPSEETNVQNSNNFLKNFGSLQLAPINKTEKKITKISFNHPLYKNVFEKKITNFQYPKVNQYFPSSGKGLPILQLEDQANFAFSVTNTLGNLYVFTAPLNKQNSNFQNSPLIVPTIYNMAQAKNNSKTNTFTIGENETLVIEAALSKDEVVSVTNATYSFIPRQQIISAKVKLSFGDYPEKGGNYSVKQAENDIQEISFNYARTESDLNNENNTLFDKATSVNDVTTVLNDLESKRTDTALWKWFILGTLLFLLIELLIQKFVK
ncbi:VWA domain-containing protein [Flavobacterium sp. NRK F7]|uniref:vWA domain-containing protein n=1 Tax=Flavobacterium sp. NRK F7 TaxID=2954930 RepID=UPI002091014C|nr:VWA domain-containing protein [Flavobacterium sp. NRK F7]MCO6163863.1 VWA domain-containing protein [Flavobacterium sp. NRK F7]